MTRASDPGPGASGEVPPLAPPLVAPLLVEAAFEAAPVGLAVLEPEAPFRVLLANPTFASDVGASAADTVTGRPFLEVLPGAERLGAHRALERVAAGPQVLLEATPSEKQMALFSATMPARILAIAERHLSEPARITIAREATAAGKLPRVRQLAYVVGRPHTPAALERVLEIESPESALVFCRTRLEVDTLVEMLRTLPSSIRALTPPALNA